MITCFIIFSSWNAFKLYIVGVVKCVLNFGMLIAYRVCSVEGIGARVILSGVFQISFYKYRLCVVCNLSFNKFIYCYFCNVLKYFPFSIFIMPIVSVIVSYIYVSCVQCVI
jgi:hypothetical protein